MGSARQQTWASAAEQEVRRGNECLAGFFALLAQPNEQERAHVCADHAVGFSRDGRRGFKCGVDGTILRWIDPGEVVRVGP